MLYVFKWPNWYALSTENGLIQFSDYGLLGTEDEEIIERLQNDPMVKFLGEGEENLVYVPENDEPKQSIESDEEIRELRKKYFEKFNKKPNAKRTLAELQEKMDQAE